MVAAKEVHYSRSSNKQVPSCSSEVMTLMLINIVDESMPLGKTPQYSRRSNSLSVRALDSRAGTQTDVGIGRNPYLQSVFGNVASTINYFLIQLAIFSPRLLRYIFSILLGVAGRHGKFQSDQPTAVSGARRCARSRAHVATGSFRKTSGRASRWLFIAILFTLLCPAVALDMTVIHIAVAVVKIFGSILEDVSKQFIPWFFGEPYWGNRTRFDVTVFSVIVYLWFRTWKLAAFEIPPDGKRFRAKQLMPYCAKCYPDYVNTCCVLPAHQFSKRTFLPLRCDRCARYPEVHGALQVEIGITSDEFRLISTYKCLNMEPEEQHKGETKWQAKDVMSAITNSFDGADNYTERHAWLNTHLEDLTLLESERITRTFGFLSRWSNHTRSFCRATPWQRLPRPAVFPAAPVVPPAPVVPAAPAPAPAPPVVIHFSPFGQFFGGPPPPPPPPAPAPAAVPPPAPGPAPGGVGGVIPGGAPPAAPAPAPVPAPMGAGAPVAGAGAAPVAPAAAAPVPAIIPPAPIPVPPGIGPVPAPAPQRQWPLLNRLRAVWLFNQDNDGKIPQMTILSGKRQFLDSIVRYPNRLKARFYQSAQVTRVEHDVQQLSPGTSETPIHGPPGQDVGFTTSPQAFRLGPVFNVFTVWNTKIRSNILSIMQGRSQTQAVYDPAADCTRGVNKCYTTFQNVVCTKEAVNRAYDEVMEACNNDPLQLLRGKFSEEEIATMLNKLEIISANKIVARVLNGKLELMAKGGSKAKTAFMRGVVDNGLMLLALNNVGPTVLEHLVFHKHADVKDEGSSAANTKVSGIFSRLCIKGEDRVKVLDRIVKECSSPPSHGKYPTSLTAAEARTLSAEMAFGEIDQTAMELHERCATDGTGLMGSFLKVLKHVNTLLKDKLGARLSQQHNARIVFDINGGMTLKIRIKGGGEDEVYTAQFKDLYLDSGWKLTSLVNFMNELFVTLCGITKNPTRIFAKNAQTGRFRVEEGTHNFIFDSVSVVPRDENGSVIDPNAPPISFPVYFRPWVEGDDGFFRVSRAFARYLKVAEERITSAGFKVKLKFIVNGRGEFVGAHFVCRDGLLDPKVPWSPAVGRYLLKLGINCSSQPTPVANAARAAALGMMFAGRVEVFCDMFYNQFIALKKELAGKDFSKLKVKCADYSAEARVFGEKEVTFQSVVDAFDAARAQPFPTLASQMSMLDNSFELPNGTFTPEHMNSLAFLATDIVGIDDEVAFSYLPPQLRE